MKIKENERYLNKGEDRKGISRMYRLFVVWCNVRLADRKQLRRRSGGSVMVKLLNLNLCFQPDSCYELIEQHEGRFDNHCK